MIAEQHLEPRQAACQWLREFGDRCNEGDLVGLYHVLHRVALQEVHFRIVEYIQDLVQATPNGSLLLSDWQENVQVTQQLPESVAILTKMACV